MQTYFKSSVKTNNLFSILLNYQSKNLFEKYDTNQALHHKNLQLIAKKLPELQSRLTLIIRQQLEVLLVQHNKSTSFTYQLQKFLEQLNQIHKQINKEILNHKNLCNSTSFKNRFKQLERNINYDETIELARMKSENIVLKDQIQQKNKQQEKIRRQLINNYQTTFRIKQNPSANIITKLYNLTYKFSNFNKKFIQPKTSYHTNKSKQHHYKNNLNKKIITIQEGQNIYKKYCAKKIFKTASKEIMIQHKIYNDLGNSNSKFNQNKSTLDNLNVNIYKISNTYNNFNAKSNNCKYLQDKINRIKQIRISLIQSQEGNSNSKKIRNILY